MKMTKMFMLVVSCCLLGSLQACSDDNDRQTGNPGGGGEPGGNDFADLTFADFAGRWECTTETWDLTREGICTEVDPSNHAPVTGPDGEKITLSVGEYCRIFADDYNAVNIPEYGQEAAITAEDVAVNVIENPDESDYYYFTFDGNGHFEFHICQLIAEGVGHFDTMNISGDATWHPDTGTFTLIDNSVADAPRRMVVTLVSWSPEETVLSITDEYPWLVSDYSGEHAYEVECTTLYSGRKTAE
mgnify:CR=1 FL=1